MLRIKILDILLIFLFLSFQTKFVLGFNSSFTNHNIKCVESEKQSLLSFKHGLLEDMYDSLSSWNSANNSDCCKWRGVQCDKNAGHVISLDLRGTDDLYLSGELSSSLGNLSHLTYLDLSNNYFSSSIPSSISSLAHLNYLNISSGLFGGHVIPSHLGNLSKLVVLDLGQNYIKLHQDKDIEWLSHLSSLKYLDLSLLDFSGVTSWANVINKLPLLESLFLTNCYLSQPYSYTSFSKFLSHLDLSQNYNLNNSSIFLINNSDTLIHLNLASTNLEGELSDELKNMVSIQYLNLASNNLEISFPNDFANMGSLAHLILESNKFVDVSPMQFGSLCSLQTLNLGRNNMKALLYDVLKSIAQCSLNVLESLDLSSNKLFGFIPSLTIFPSLRKLSLSNNTLNGTIPQSLGQLSNLVFLSLGSNALEGVVNEVHFTKLIKLRVLDLSQNSLILNFKSDWIPPFRSKYIHLGSCKLGPLFPKWLRTQKFVGLSMFATGISDVTPHWFWANLSPELEILDLSKNKIKGEIPNISSIEFEGFAPMFFLNSNEFTGEIPRFLSQARVLDLSNNKFSGVSLLCETADSSFMKILDLSNNQLSGQLPNCWNSTLELESLNLANNSFVGNIPHSMGSLNSLKSLNLHKNRLSGELPSWFNFTNLVLFDVRDNELSGTIPKWIGLRLPNLVYLNLKMNQFDGQFPQSLCNLKSLRVLDISSNNISGMIPTCISNFSSLKQKTNAQSINYLSIVFVEATSQFLFEKQSYGEFMAMMWKGTEQIWKGKGLELQKSIDLSRNHFVGKIPNEITELVQLINLNLSRNDLTGRIPKEMGRLKSLQSMDLSRNRISGEIPSSLSQISMLSRLNLSYNNLSGTIPTGTQLQSFEPSYYEGNPYLCGAPLRKCEEEEVQGRSTNTTRIENGAENGLIRREFWFGITLGLVVGFWGAIGSLILNEKWRHMYFKFFSRKLNGGARHLKRGGLASPS